VALWHPILLTMTYVSRMASGSTYAMPSVLTRNLYRRQCERTPMVQTVPHGLQPLHSSPGPVRNIATPVGARRVIFRTGDSLCPQFAIS